MAEATELFHGAEQYCRECSTLSEEVQSLMHSAPSLPIWNLLGTLYSICQDAVSISSCCPFRFVNISFSGLRPDHRCWDRLAYERLGACQRSQMLLGGAQSYKFGCLFIYFLLFLHARERVSGPSHDAVFSVCYPFTHTLWIICFFERLGCVSFSSLSSVPGRSLFRRWVCGLIV